MTDKEIKEMLKTCTNMSAHDIENHLNAGVIVHSDFEEFKTECLNSLCDIEDIKSIWDSMEIVEYNGNTYHIDYVL